MIAGLAIADSPISLSVMFSSKRTDLLVRYTNLLALFRVSSFSRASSTRAVLDGLDGERAWER